ncbi:hypothetical protein JaAD80_27180 [Janthinobacterium sp. AD80]|nr:hypothetical protein JaAD80_27180 [Janthinobacterium sp. AD80]
MPAPISSSGPARAAPLPSTCDSQASPAAVSSRPAAHRVPAVNQRSSSAASTGTSSSGAASAIISRPAASGDKPSVPMKRPGSMTMSTINRKAGAAASTCTPTKRRWPNRRKSSMGCAVLRSIRIKTDNSNAARTSGSSTAALRQPCSGASSMPTVNKASAALKLRAPGQSRRPWPRGGSAGTLTATSSVPMAPSAAVA